MVVAEVERQPDTPNLVPLGRLAGKRLGRLTRVSSRRQSGNWSEIEQEQEMDRLVEREGGIVLPYDEGAISGKDLSKRKVALQLLDDIDAGRVDGMVAYDIKRITRDEYGIDGGTIAKRLTTARALLVTHSKTYRLWEDDDFFQFRIMCDLAGYDIRGKKKEFWRGLMGRASNEVFFFKPPIGYATRLEEYQRKVYGGERAKIKRIPIKDPTQADLMAAIEDAFNTSVSIGEAARRLNDAQMLRLATNGPHKGQPVAWTADMLWKLLRNPIYWGEWEFGYTVDKRNTIWEGNRERDFRREVPELAFWTKPQVAAWRRKFEANRRRQGSTRGIRIRKHLHPLIGVLACASCGADLISAAQYRGKNAYICPNRNNRRACPKPTNITEAVALRMLRQILPDLLPTPEDLAKEAQRQLTQQSHVQDLRRELQEKEEQQREATEQWLAMRVKPAYLTQRLEEQETAIQALRERIDHEEQLGWQHQEPLADLLGLPGQVEHLVDTVWADDTLAQARVYRLLVSGVKIKGEGAGSGRRFEITGYAPSASLARNPHAGRDQPGDGSPAFFASADARCDRGNGHQRHRRADFAGGLSPGQV